MNDPDDIGITNDQGEFFGGADIDGDVLLKTKPKNIVVAPIGLQPKWSHDQNRIIDILEAMLRYSIVVNKIPQEWIDELTELNNLERTNKF